ncbi:MAG: hypothetical protein V7L26_17535 [Nostoc sp.]|uniref:hypothetical protein n=1 Tax=Nostoc sp. TaxID=1180 RepID=UPI002FF96DDC
MTDETTSQEEALANSYEIANCPITLNLQIFPDDGSVEGRQIVIGIRNHQDPPIIKSCRSEDFTCGVIPQLIDELLAELKAELPARLLAAVERDRLVQSEVDETDEDETELPTKSKSKKSKSKSALPSVEVGTVAGLTPTDDVEQTTLNLFG